MLKLGIGALVCEFRFDGWCCSSGKHDGSIGRENGQMQAWLPLATDVKFEVLSS
jgi:hypothetical protein